MNTIGVLKDNCNLATNKVFNDGETNFYLSLENDGIYLCSTDFKDNKFDILKITNDCITLYASLNKNENNIGIKEVFDTSINRYVNVINTESEEEEEEEEKYNEW